MDLLSHTKSPKISYSRKVSVTAETSASNVGRVLTQRVDWVAWTSIELNGARDVIILTCATSSVLHPSKEGARVAWRSARRLTLVAIVKVTYYRMRLSASGILIVRNLLWV